MMHDGVILRYSAIRFRSGTGMLRRNETVCEGFRRILGEELPLGTIFGPSPSAFQVVVPVLVPSPESTKLSREVKDDFFCPVCGKFQINEFIYDKHMKKNHRVRVEPARKLSMKAIKAAVMKFVPRALLGGSVSNAQTDGVKDGPASVAASAVSIGSPVDGSTTRTDGVKGGPASVAVSTVSIGSPVDGSTTRTDGVQDGPASVAASTVSVGSPDDGSTVAANESFGNLYPSLPKYYA